MQLAREATGIHLDCRYEAVAISIESTEDLLQLGHLGLLHDLVAGLVGTRELLTLLLDKVQLFISCLLALLHQHLVLLVKTLSDHAGRGRSILDGNISVDLRLEQLTAGLRVKQHLALVSGTTLLPHDPLTCVVGLHVVGKSLEDLAVDRRHTTRCRLGSATRSLGASRATIKLLLNSMVDDDVVSLAELLRGLFGGALAGLGAQEGANSALDPLANLRVLGDQLRLERALLIDTVGVNELFAHVPVPCVVVQGKELLLRRQGVVATLVQLLRRVVRLDLIGGTRASILRLTERTVGAVSG